MQKNIYLVRHGQTDFNLQKIVQGRGIDSDLNETGRWQADRFYTKYKNVRFDAVFTSQLKRTFQTVEPFVLDGYDHEVRRELDEISWGVFEGQKHDFLDNGDFKVILDSWGRGELTNKVEGGESPLELHKRQKPLIEKLRSMDFNNLLLCSHGRAIRALVCGFLNLPLTEMDKFPHSNTCLYKISVRDNSFQVELANDTSHLM